MPRDVTPSRSRSPCKVMTEGGRESTDFRGFRLGSPPRRRQDECWADDELSDNDDDSSTPLPTTGALAEPSRQDLAPHPRADFAEDGFDDFDSVFDMSSSEESSYGLGCTTSSTTPALSPTTESKPFALHLARSTIPDADSDSSSDGDTDADSRPVASSRSVGQRARKLDLKLLELQLAFLAIDRRFDRA